MVRNRRTLPVFTPAPFPYTLPTVAPMRPTAQYPRRNA